MKRLWLAALLVACWTAAAPGAGSEPFFSNRTVHRIALRLDDTAMRTLRHSPRQDVRGTVSDATGRWTNVAVHLKGATGSFRPIDEKPGFTLSFAPSQRFHGLSKIHLNNSVEDPACANDWLGSEMCRRAGLPAPEVAHAVVELNGKRLGLYVVKEGFTPEFIAKHLPGVRGTFFEPGPGHDVDEALDEKWNTVSPGAANLDALATAIKEPDVARRWQQLERVLDVDKFASFLALEVLLGHRDGYSLARNNFRVFVPENGRAIFLPSGMDQLFGRAPSSIEPHFNGKVARAFVETHAGRELYLRRTTALLTNAFDERVVLQRLNELGATLKPVLSRAEYRDWQRSTAELKSGIAARQQRMSDEAREMKRRIRGRIKV